MSRAAVNGAAVGGFTNEDGGPKAAGANRAGVDSKQITGSTGYYKAMATNERREGDTKAMERDDHERAKRRKIWPLEPVDGPVGSVCSPNCWEPGKLLLSRQSMTFLSLFFSPLFATSTRCGKADIRLSAQTSNHGRGAALRSQAPQSPQPPPSIFTPNSCLLACPFLCDTSEARTLTPFSPAA